MQFDSTDKSRANDFPVFVFARSEARHWKRVISTLFVVAVGLGTIVNIGSGMGGNPLYGQTSKGVGAGFGTHWPEGHPDRVYLEQLNDVGLHALAIDVTARNRAELEGNGLVNSRAQWGMLWLESNASQLASQISEKSDTPEKLAELTVALKRLTEKVAAERRENRGAWIDFKLAWCRWFIARNCVATYLATPTRAPLREWTLNQIRFALDELDKLQRDLAAIPTGVNSNRGKNGPTASEVSSLAATGKLLACDLLDLRAHLYGDNVDERIACGTQMIQLLNEAESKIGIGWSDFPKIDVARARAWMYLGQPTNAISVAQKYRKESDALVVDWLPQLSAIVSESLRNKGDFEKAKEWIEIGGGWKRDPSLALEYLAVQISKDGKQKDREGLDEKSLALALELKKEIATRFGPYWALRTDAMLISMNRNEPNNIASTRVPNDASVELLRTEVKQLLAGKQWKQAIEKLQQAEVATTNNETALGFAMQGAALWGLQKEFEMAADEFYRAAFAYADSPSASKSAMNSVTMIQSRIRQIIDESTADANSRQELLKGLLQTRSRYWLDIANRWPSTENGTIAANSLSDYYIATGLILEACEFWIAMWEKQTTSEKDIHSTPSHVPRNSLQLLRLVAWLKNQVWLDSTLLPKDCESRCSELTSRVKKLVQNDFDRKRDLEDIERFEAGFGWEYRRPSTDQPIQSWYEKWILGHLIAAEISNGRDQAVNTQQLKTLTTDLILEMEKDSIADSVLKTQVKRSITCFEAQLDALLGNLTNAKSKLSEMEKLNPQDPWWLYYSGRIYQGIPSERDSAEKRFWKLANGLPAGSAGWLECRARTMELLESQGKKEEATKLSKLVLTISGNLPDFWVRRLKK